MLLGTLFPYRLLHRFTVYMAVPMARLMSSQVFFISPFLQPLFFLAQVLMHYAPNCLVRIEVLAYRSIRGKWAVDLLSYAANGSIGFELLSNNPIFMEDRCIHACCLLARLDPIKSHDITERYSSSQWGVTAWWLGSWILVDISEFFMALLAP
jgi:hypothetical protein